MKKTTTIFKSNTVALDGTTHVEIVPAPGPGDIHRFTTLRGVNGSGATRRIFSHLNDNGTISTLWTENSTNNAMWTPFQLSGPIVEYDIHLGQNQSIELDQNGTGTSRMYAGYEILEEDAYFEEPRLARRTTSVALSGTSDVTLLEAPPAGQAFIARRFYVVNQTGFTRIFSIEFDKASTQTLVFLQNRITNQPWNPRNTADGQQMSLNVALTASDETLVVKLNGTGTDRVVLDYDVAEDQP